MNKINQTFSDIKQNTPKHIQWLFLIAAFLVVLILLILLLSDNKKTEIKTETSATDAVLDISPGQIDWTESEIGKSQNLKISVLSNIDTKITLVKFSNEVSNLTMRSTCANMGIITSKIPCSITVDWNPKTATEKTAAEIQITYRASNAPDKLTKLEIIPIVISTKSGVAKTETAPLAPAEIEKLLADTPSLAPNLKTENKPEPENKSEPIPAPESKTTAQQRTEACYEFAFPGYNLSGNQIGWIKPIGGRYEFHQFSDKNCSNPTGNYNPDTGIITDIADSSKKIGSDAEHIGFGTIASGATIPMLSNASTKKSANRARQLLADELKPATGGAKRLSAINTDFAYKPTSSLIPSSAGDAYISSEPYDRTFVLRQYKPIPATIVNEIRAEAKLVNLPVQATVDRHVYSDNGRTIVVPAGTLMLGYLTGELPGPYKSIGRMEIKWYRFVRPDGVEFNFGDESNRPFAGDSQGRVGVPGYGSTDYIEQFLMPMITAVVPAAVNMIAPVSDKFVSQINLDSNTVTQSGTMRSSELAKNEIVTAWNKVAQRLMVDMMDNTVPPFSIAAGTRITVYSPKDLIVNFCGKVNGVDKCGDLIKPSPYVAHVKSDAVADYTDQSWIGQVRSFDLSDVCDKNGGVAANAETLSKKGMDYRTAVMMCQSTLYQAKTTAQQQAVNQDLTNKGGVVLSDGTVAKKGTKEYNQGVLGLQYNEQGNIKNPFQKEAAPAAAPATLTCEDGTTPSTDGCCTGETYTDMGEAGFNCCPNTGGDCFPPIK